MELVHTCLRVLDPDRSLRFYEALGFERRGRLNFATAYNLYLGLPGGPDGSAAARTIQVWTGLFGLVGFELFGHLHNVVEHRDDYFAGAVDRLGDLVGLPAR